MESPHIIETSIASKDQSDKNSNSTTNTPQGAPVQARPSTALPEELLSAAVSADLAGTWGEAKGGWERKDQGVDVRGTEDNRERMS